MHIHKIAGCIDLTKSAKQDDLFAYCSYMQQGAEHWVNAEEGIGISSTSGTIKRGDVSVCAYDGAIYNRDELAQQLNLRLDLELDEMTKDILLLDESLRRYGLVKTLERLSGAFAIAVWNDAEKTLTLVLDRIGVKSIYYGRSGSWFFFASEIDSIERHPQFHSELDFGALGLFYRHNYIPAPNSIYKDIKKMLPGTCFHIKPGEHQCGFVEHYWNPVERFHHAIANKFHGTFDDAMDELETRLTASVLSQLSRAPGAGAFLSGGIDSSLISVIAQKVSSGSLKTFSIGFPETGYDEAPFGRKIAEHIGSIHDELYITPEMALEVVKGIPEIYAEPFADSSQIPTTLLFQRAKRSVGAALSGDGGDEIFGGYWSYRLANRIWHKISPQPIMIRKLAAATLQGISRIGFFSGHFRQRADKLARIAKMTTPEAIYRCIGSLNEPTPDILLCPEAPSLLTDPSRWAREGELMERMMFLDFGMYLPDDGIVKVREAAAYSGMFSLSPLLDHSIVEFAWSLPLRYKISGDTGKHILRELLYKYIPKELVDRPKRGFSAPLPQWLNNRLSSWAEDLWNTSQEHIDSLFGDGYAHKLRRYYNTLPKAESRWGILQLLQWLGRRS